VLLEVKEPGSPLDVGKRFNVAHLLPLENLAAAECPLELTNELFEVVLHHAVQVHQIAIDIVQHFSLRRHRAQEKQCAPSSENFDVTLVRWKQWDQTIGEAPFPAEPGDDGICRVHSFGLSIDARGRSCVGLSALSEFKVPHRGHLMVNSI
jgi:hypothetical protein